MHNGNRSGRPTVLLDGEAMFGGTSCSLCARRKYYDLVAYERTETLKAAQSRGSGREDQFDARADEEALRLKKLEERRQQQQDRLNTAYNILKHTDMAKDMREQVGIHKYRKSSPLQDGC